MTPRQRYFKVADSILNENWTAEQRGIVVGIMAYLHERWRTEGLTPEEAGTCVLSSSNITRITDKKRLDAGIRLLRDLTDIASITFEVVGKRKDSVQITWPKFPIFQGLPTRKTPSPDPDPEPEPEEDKEDPKKTKRAVRKRPLPDDLKLTDDLIRYATAKGIPADRIPDLWEHFTDHHRQKGNQFADWHAAWRTWVRNDLKFHPPAEPTAWDGLQVWTCTNPRCPNPDRVHESPNRAEVPKDHRCTHLQAATA